MAPVLLLKLALVPLLIWLVTLAALQALPMALGVSFAVVWGALLLTGRLFPQTVPDAAGATQLGAPRAGGMQERLLKTVTLSQYCSNPFNQVPHEEQHGCRRKRNPWLSS